MDIEALYVDHDYEPYGNSAVGKAEVQKYILQCRNALKELQSFVDHNPELSAEELSESYAKVTGLPTPPAKTFSALPLSS